MNIRFQKKPNNNIYINYINNNYIENKNNDLHIISKLLNLFENININDLKNCIFLVKKIMFENITLTELNVKYIFIQCFYDIRYIIRNCFDDNEHLVDFINIILSESNEYCELEGEILKIFKNGTQITSSETTSAQSIPLDEEETAIECPICFKEINDTTHGKCFQCDKCKKYVCLTCIAKWRKNCPWCRSEIMQCFPGIPLN